MSKVLIDRELLERAVYRLELAYDADAPIVCDLSSVLSAPSGTPAMPVKAYYHEAPNEYGGLNKSVGLEVRKTFIDTPLVLESDALAQIACLEGEIAKRDARIVELERYDEAVERAAFEAWHKERYPAVKIRVQNLLGTYTDMQVECNFETWLACAESHSNRFGGALLDASARLNGPPASEAKAQGVVMPERQSPDDEWHSVMKDRAIGWNACLDEIARLNAAPVQQVSAPDKFCIGAWRDALEKIAKYAPQVNCAARTELERAGLIAVHALIAFSAPQLRPARGTQTASNAAQAAPAADARLVEALDYQAMFDAIAAATSVYANGAINISVQAFRDALAANRAKGVV